MKLYKNVMVSVALVAGLMLLATAALPRNRADAQQAVVTDDNLAQMITNAKMPADHQAIAAHYDNAAAKANDMAAAHERMRTKYLESPSLQSAGPSYGRVAAKDCEVLQRSYLNIADEDALLANVHREMAAKLDGAH